MIALNVAGTKSFAITSGVNKSYDETCMSLFLTFSSTLTPILNLITTQS